MRQNSNIKNGDKPSEMKSYNEDITENTVIPRSGSSLSTVPVNESVQTENTLTVNTNNDEQLITLHLNGQHLATRNPSDTNLPVLAVDHIPVPLISDDDFWNRVEDVVRFIKRICADPPTQSEDQMRCLVADECSPSNLSQSVLHAILLAAKET